MGLGHEVFIVSNHYLTDDNFVFFEESDAEVDVAWEWFGRSGIEKFDKDKIRALADAVDVIHIQYESFLWHHNYITYDNFYDIFGDTPVVCTFHSSGIHPAWPVGKFAATIQHDIRLQSSGNRYIVPMGVPEWEIKKETEPVLMSFGLGRNNDDFCREAIKIANEQHGTSLSYDAQYGDKKWVSESALQSRLQRARYHALIYPPVGANVSSSAVCQALATAKPVFTSQTNWFEHVRDYVHMVETPCEMAILLSTYESPAGKFLKAEQRSHKDLINERGMTRIGQMHEEIYKKCISGESDDKQGT